MTDHIVVLGLGNTLLQDEGLGVRAVERFSERYALPDHVTTLDGGTLGLALLPHVADAHSLLIFDAVRRDQLPGTLLRLEGEAIPMTLSLSLSMHQIGLQEMLAAGQFQGVLPERIVVWGMQPESLEWGTELTPTVAARLDHLVDAAAGELLAWGVPMQPNS